MTEPIPSREWEPTTPWLEGSFARILRIPASFAQAVQPAPRSLYVGGRQGYTAACTSSWTSRDGQGKAPASRAATPCTAPRENETHEDTSRNVSCSKAQPQKNGNISRDSARDTLHRGCGCCICARCSPRRRPPARVPHLVRRLPRPRDHLPHPPHRLRVRRHDADGAHVVHDILCRDRLAPVYRPTTTQKGHRPEGPLQVDRPPISQKHSTGATQTLPSLGGLRPRGRFLGHLPSSRPELCVTLQRLFGTPRGEFNTDGGEALRPEPPLPVAAYHARTVQVVLVRTRYKSCLFPHGKTRACSRTVQGLLAPAR